MSWLDDTLYKIGYAPNALVSFRNIKVPVPDQIVWQAASQYYARSDMSRVGDGFAVISWTWDVISYECLARLLEFLDGKESNELYAKTDVRDGTYAVAANAFKVYKATMWKPLLFGQEGSPIVRTAKAYQTVQVKLVNAVEQIGYL
jgi:hypothetical protein